MTFKRTFIALSASFCLGAPFGCSKAPEIRTLVLENGHKYQLLGIDVIQSPLVEGKPAFALSYISKFPLSDPSRMQPEIEDLEIFLVLNAEKQHLNFALLEIHDGPPAFFGVSKNIGYIYERGNDGKWRHRGDSAVIPMAFPSFHKPGA